VRCLARSGQARRTLNDASAPHKAIGIVEYCGLAGSSRALRLVKDYGSLGTRDRDLCQGRFVILPYPDKRLKCRTFERRVMKYRGVAIDGRAEERGIIRDDDTVAHGIKSRHV